MVTTGLNVSPCTVMWLISQCYWSHWQLPLHLQYSRGHSHWPVYVVHQSIDALSCIGLSPNTPLFHNFTCNYPLSLFVCLFCFVLFCFVLFCFVLFLCFVLFFYQYFPANHQILKNHLLIAVIFFFFYFWKMLTLPGFCAISHPMTQLFWIYHPMIPLFFKKIVTNSLLIWCVGRRTPSL